MKFKCLLCSIQCVEVSTLKGHYISHHRINEEDFCFKELFSPDTIEKTCNFCGETFRSCRVKKNHMFLYHYGTQIGSQRNTKPINILKRGNFTHYSINFEQHNNFYNFFKSDLVGEFIGFVCQKFTSTKERRTFQWYAGIINQQRGETNFLDNKHVWLTNSFESKHFNSFVMGELRDEILK